MATIPADHFLGERAIQHVETNQSILISASSFEAISRRQGKPGEIFVPEIPDNVSEIAVDPGGFVAQIRYGGYRFTWQTFVDWLHALGAKLTWAAFPDLPCEPELASDEYAVRARQETTLEYANALWVSPDCSHTGDVGQDDTDRDYSSWRSQPWSWVATVQGRSIKEYEWMAKQLAPLLSSQQFQYDYMAYALDVIGDSLEEETQVHARATQQWAARCAQHRRVAIGSLCKRKDLIEACRIVCAVAEILPDIPLHLWGIDQRLLPLLQRAGVIDRVASFDTSAYNGRFASGIQKVDAERKRLGLSQRSHADAVLLPRYARRVDGRLAQTILDI